MTQKHETDPDVQLTPETTRSAHKESRKSFTVQQKMELVLRARDVGVKQAIKECPLPIHHSMLYRWMKRMDDFAKIDNKDRNLKSKPGSGRRTYLTAECEARLADWILVHRQMGMYVGFHTIKELLTQWNKDGLLEFNKNQDGSDPQISFCRNWFDNFCRRNGV